MTLFPISLRVATRKFSQEFANCTVYHETSEGTLSSHFFASLCSLILLAVWIFQITIMAPKSRISNSISNKTFANLALGIQDGEWWRLRKKYGIVFPSFVSTQSHFPRKKPINYCPVTTDCNFFMVFYWENGFELSLCLYFFFFVASVLPRREQQSRANPDNKTDALF